ncbi:hypothetical protein CTAYLR_008454 [Chrysophaeum taylorii]|uniref:Uncharacterized protein n=1 Tax=Chrysophaeum taylorii TaxID=2483200 RepID=A0AAD7XKF0_9STRA|nr:hypothetical protein CTAYLR_008454 [Chrysophaeum taylorii]
MIGAALAPGRPATRLYARFATFDAAEEAALAKCQDGDYDGALALFEEALTLPGDGYDVRRVSAKTSPINGAVVPRDLEEVRFASLSQRQTTFYNMACVYAKKGDEVEALEALEKALSLGFDDYDLITQEEDFESIKQDAGKLIDQYKPRSWVDALFFDKLKRK